MVGREGGSEREKERERSKRDNKYLSHSTLVAKATVYVYSCHVMDSEQ